MKERERLKRLLKFLEMKSVYGMGHAGVKIADIVQDLQVELAKNNFTSEKIKLIEQNIRIATTGKITWDTMVIPYGRESFGNWSKLEPEHQDKSDFWARSSTYKLRAYKK
jgi:hypothetical protein